MAQRLSLKVGFVPDTTRSTASPDAVVVVEPSVGSIARTKGSLFLVVSSRSASARHREATRRTAEAIRSEYYYDESAGVRACLEKVIVGANKRLWHERDRLGMAPSEAAGPIGIALAVVRGSELYVATVGPAEAYLIRGARLSTLPDPERDRGLPTPDLVPDVWRGELAIGDQLVLVATNLVTALGPEAIQDTAVRLHPQSAAEELLRRFDETEAEGGDGLIALEAGEASTIQAPRSLVPVRAAEPLAGAPDRSPIPLADSMEDGVAAVSATARQARDAAGGLAGRGLRAFQERLPQRNPIYRRVIGTSARQESQRRAAVALIALVVVAGGLGLAVWLAGGSGPRESVASLTAGQRALEAARISIDEVWAPGVDLVEDDPDRARDLLEEAGDLLDEAEAAGVPRTTIAPLRTRVVAGLDDIFGVVEVRPADVFVFPADLDPRVDLVGLIQGPDGRAFAIDAASGTVFRIESADATATPILVRGAEVAGAIVGQPNLLAVGGRDLLIVDDQNTLWRWVPADDAGKGTVTRLPVGDASGWGDDILAIDTFCRTGDCALYNLYVVDPSERQLRVYTPRADGGGFPGPWAAWLATERDVSGVTDMYIDGDLFLVDAGTIERFTNKRAGGWDPDELEDSLLRPDPRYTLIASADPRKAGVLYAYDAEHARVIAFEKESGAYLEQYRLRPGDRGWEDLRGMYVVPGIEDAPDTLVWVEADRLRSASLEAVVGVRPSPSPGPSPSPSPGPSPSP